MNLVEALAGEIGPRTAGSDDAARAADTVAEAFRELGLAVRFQEFQLLGYEPDEPLLEVEGERWAAGPCMYSHAFDGEGTVRTDRVRAARRSATGGSRTSQSSMRQAGRSRAS